MAVDLSVTDNPLSIPEQVLFEMAARVNKKGVFYLSAKCWESIFQFIR